jgi:hypothetical protein
MVNTTCTIENTHRADSAPEHSYHGTDSCHRTVFKYLAYYGKAITAYSRAPDLSTPGPGVSTW